MCHSASTSWSLSDAPKYMIASIDWAVGDFLKVDIHMIQSEFSFNYNHDKFQRNNRRAMWNDTKLFTVLDPSILTWSIGFPSHWCQLSSKLGRFCSLCAFTHSIVSNTNRSTGWYHQGITVLITWLNLWLYTRVVWGLPSFLCFR